MPSKVSLNTIANTGLKVSSLGLGCASLAGIFTPVPEESARGTIAKARTHGITYFDTAPFYGHGLSERLTGDGIRSDPNLVISTKVGRILEPGASQDPGAWVSALPFTPKYDYTYDGIMRSFEDSLQRLGRDKIDILYIHDIGVATHGTELNSALFEDAMTGGYRALESLRSSGVVKAIGLGVNETEVCMSALDRGDWDVFLLAGRYTLLEQDKAISLLDKCMKENTDIIVGGPFNSGVLVGGDSFDYGKIPAEIAERVQKLQRVCDTHSVPLPAAALQFPLGHPIVKSVIPGPRTPKELDQNMQWWNHKIPTAFWDNLKAEGLIHPQAFTPI